MNHKKLLLRKLSIVFTLIIMVFLSIGVHSQVLLNENFDYTAGTLLTANGWTNHSGTSNFITVATSSISYPGYSSSGIGNEVSLTTTGEDVNKTFTQQTTGIVFASFLVNITSATTTGDYFLHFCPSAIGTDFKGKVFAKKDASNNLYFGVSKGLNTPIWSSSAYLLNSTYLIVLKYSIVSGSANDIVSLYIEPLVGGTEPSVPTISATDITGVDIANIGAIALRQGNATNAPALKLDGIRVATSWADIFGASTPTISTPSPISLTGFSTTSGTASASQVFTVAANGLTSDLVVTAPTDFEVRESGIGSYASSVSFTPSSGTVSTKTIDVRIAASAAIGSPSGNVVCSSTGATSQNVSVSGTVIAASSPLITTTGALNPFSNTAINSFSSEQSYTVEGINLTANLIITPPSGFQISTGTGASFVATNPVLLPPTGGIVNTTTIYVRFAPTAVQSYIGNITHTSIGALQIDKVVSGIGINAEPTNHATGFQAATGTPTFSAVIVSWTDATAGIAPDGYLIKGSTVGYGSITSPTDGVAETDGGLVKNITQGTGIYEFTGLTGSTTYYFRIFPYTNSGIEINYKTDGIVPESSVITDIQPVITYTWNVTSGKGVWTVASNWTPNRTFPANNDILQFNNGVIDTITGVPAQTIGQLFVLGNTAVYLQAAAVGTLSIAGNTGTDLSVTAGSQLNVTGTNALTIKLLTTATASINGSMSFYAAAHKFDAVDAGSIVLENGSVITQGIGSTGNLFTNAGTQLVALFKTGSTFIQIAGSNPFGFSAPGSKIVFQDGSLYRFEASGGSPSLSNRTFANLEFNSLLTNVSLDSMSGGGSLTLNNLIVTSGNVGISLTGGVNIKGDITIASGSSLKFNPGLTANINLIGLATQTISGGGIIKTKSKSNLNINNVYGVNVNDSLTIGGTLTLTNGNLNLGANITFDSTSLIAGSPSITSMIIPNNFNVYKIFNPIDGGGFTFPMGESLPTVKYLPVNIAFTTGTIDANNYVGIKGFNQKNPNDMSTGNYLNRYWNIEQIGITNFTCSANFQYDLTDVVGSEGLILCKNFSTNPIAVFDVANTTLHQLTATDITQFGAFGGGENLISKTLNLTLLIESLFNGVNMNPASDEMGPKWGANVADHITVELQNAVNPFTNVITFSDQILNTDGTCTITIPAAYGNLYYVVIKHRNSLETWSGTPISFSGSTINCNFSSAADAAYGSNLKQVVNGVWAIYSGDADGSGYIDGDDFNGVDNILYTSGYLNSDVDGNGYIDGDDFNIIDNNLYNGVVSPVTP